ncbi:MAG: hypothetical protein ACYDAO_08655 [Thermoplasmataceae archaeon]
MGDDIYKNLHQFSELGNKTRRSIFFKIYDLKNPNFNLISKELKIKNGVLAYHLGSLCESGLVIREKSLSNNINIFYKISKDGNNLITKIENSDQDIHPVSKSLSEIGDHYFTEAKYDDAIKMYTLSIELSPDYGKSIFNKVLSVYLSKNNKLLNEALTELEDLDKIENRIHSDIPCLQGLILYEMDKNSKNKVADYYHDSINRADNEIWEKMARLKLKSIAPKIELIEKNHDYLRKPTPLVVDS